MSAQEKAAVGRFTELEAYRGVAALGVVIFHAMQTSRVTVSAVYEGTPVYTFMHGLESGVAWFFVLSGFLIFLPFARAAVTQGRAESARGFLVRRAVRIIPLYYLAILIVWTLRYTGSPAEWLDLAEHLSFTQIFDRVHIFWTIGPAWSLAVEVLFYLLVAILGPLAYRVCSRLPTPEARLRLLTSGVVALLVLSVLYKGWAYFIAAIPREDWPVYFGLPAKLDTFALGMLLALISLGSAGRPLFAGWAPSLLRVAGGGLLALGFVLREVSDGVDLYFHTVAGLAFLLVLSSTVLGPRNTPWERALSWPPLAFIGLISYSVYIWHEPIMIELDKQHIVDFTSPVAFPLATLVLLLLTIGVGALSYWAIESPLALLRHIFNRQGGLAARYPD